MRKRAGGLMRTVLAVAACALVFAATPAAAAGMRGSAAPPHPLRLTVGTLGGIGSLDPRHGDSTIAQEVWNLQYPTLTGLDPKTLDPAPGLASGWGPAAAGRGWIYTLHKNLAWSDGQPVTADDVVYSFDHARDEQWAYATGMLTGLKIRALNDRTVEVTSPNGTRQSPGLLLHVVPAHVYEKAADVGTDVAELGVSDGTWHVVSTSSDSVQLDATEGTAGPALQQIVFRTYPDATALIDAIAHKKVDVVSGVPDGDIGRLESLSNVTVNHASDGTKYVVRFVAFPETRLRQAVSLAIDRSELVAAAVNGVGTPAAIDAAPEAAKAELQAAHSSGTAETTIAIPPDAAGQRVGAIVRDDLAAAGLETRVVDEHGVGSVQANLAIERIPSSATSSNEVDLFEPDTLQAFRTDNVTGFLPDPEVRSLVVFGPTLAQYGELTAAGPPPGEGSSNSVYALGAVIVLVLSAGAYWIASRFRRRYVSAEEIDVST